MLFILYFLTVKPLIEVHEVRSLGHIPSIDITFANGIKDSMILERFYPTEDSKRAIIPPCNFFGYLLKDKTACVSVTGCFGQDDMEITINSVNSGPNNMYILHKNGDLEMVESAFKVCTLEYLISLQYGIREQYTSF